MTKHLGPFFLLRTALACALTCFIGSSVSFGAPVFSYSFPASWNGTGTTIVDQSAAAHNGVVNNTSPGALALSANVPPGATAGTQSITTNGGAIVTSATQLLTNPIVAAAGGFRYDVSFLWDGTDSSASNGGVEKIIDYAGTESLQLTVPTGGGSAQLQMGTSLDAGNIVVAASTTILPNTWYNVAMTFNTLGNPVVAGDLTGLVSLYVNGSLVSSGAAIKGTQGDTLNRPIGVGQLALPSTHLVFLRGRIYNPSVSLGVPEPASLVLLSLVGVFGFALRKRS
jgi:Concanavalin A-like lectin/glucanases superfamily/PEP-CTERM motif